MAITRSQTRLVPAKNLAQTGADDIQEKAIHVLGFGVGNDHYGVDIHETMNVLRDLMMIQASTPKSVTNQFIRRNRGNTIVFNLEECLAIQWGGRIDRTKTSFLMLDERIQDSCVGILVPGIPAIRKQSYTGIPASRGKKSGFNTPIRGVIKNPHLKSRKNIWKTVSLIDLRELVENCITHLKYRDSLHPAVQ